VRADASAPAFHAFDPFALVLTDARPPALLASAPSTLVLAEARPTAILAFAPLALVRADTARLLFRGAPRRVGLPAPPPLAAGWSEQSAGLSSRSSEGVLLKALQRDLLSRTGKVPRKATNLAFVIYVYSIMSAYGVVGDSETALLVGQAQTHVAPGPVLVAQCLVSVAGALFKQVLVNHVVNELLL
jgi:hypothetical protein